jgi:hypothetical protein
MFDIGTRSRNALPTSTRVALLRHDQPMPSLAFTWVYRSAAGQMRPRNARGDGEYHVVCRAHLFRISPPTRWLNGTPSQQPASFVPVFGSSAQDGHHPSWNANGRAVITRPASAISESSPRWSSTCLVQEKRSREHCSFWVQGCTCRRLLCPAFGAGVDRSSGSCADGLRAVPQLVPR